MYTLTDIREELKIKERSVSDLIRYIKTRTDDNPNYSLLLGAGCSVTSGIRSANELIKIWKREIAECEEGSSLSDVEINEYITKTSWYNVRNPYSSLFEKRYDLPRQRRMFVEQEVRDKIPSIGYAYLTKLVESNYFKTIFTTNFDDLLNEAFYQFSIHRPIVCAHDSAINSITVTSKRPKIVKLHGDYLFDDIKSTLRETESLEENIKNKFIEFAKDYGLIVVGYGGNDRSIVDVITYLLKNEEFFKHGIYWCLRDDSEINDDLKKLLWKDRVFYVKIDGFDELFSEISAKLSSCQLPVDSNLLNNKKTEMLKKITNNPFLIKTNCTYLQNDFKRIRKTLEQDVINSFLKYLVDKEDQEDAKDDSTFERKGIRYNLTKTEELVFAEIQSLFIQGDNESALKVIQKHLEQSNKGTLFHRGLLERKAKCLRIMLDDDNSISIYEELIDSYGDNANYYVSLSHMYPLYNSKIEILNKALEKYKYKAKLYYEKAKLMHTKYINSISKNELNFTIDDVIEIIDHCIELEPGIDNEYWGLKFELINQKYENVQEKIEHLESFLKKYEIQDPFHPSFVYKKAYTMRLKKENKNLIYDFITQKIEGFESSKYIKYNEMNLLQQYSHFHDRDLLKKRLDSIESKYKVDNDYWRLKAEFMLDEFDNLSETIAILDNIKKKDRITYQKLFIYYLYDRQIDKAKEIFYKEFPKDKERECELLSYENKYEEALDIIITLRKDREYDENLIIQATFYLLKLERYNEAENLAFKYLTKTSYKNSILYINYLLAEKKLKKTVKKEKVHEKLLCENSDSIHKAAAYAILGEKENALRALEKAIKEDYSYKYRIREWILFEEYHTNSKYKELIGL
ncbi:SIR2 family protein [Parabacteroides chongii]|uniref:SIR2 family protein n=1 Tax=Parabacteroides chongii TaxID=2685834 RepID=UPI00240D48A7|nr:SIR2 family protein [Parabacteroides chongii]WFE83272.1 SIR2 family protein [Parabacteroides chongii]